MSDDKSWTTIPITKKAMKKVHENKPEGQAYHIYITKLIEKVDEQDD